MSSLNKESKVNDKDSKNIEVWEDIVSIKDLVLALLVSSITTLGAYFIAPNEPPKPLFFGLGGAILGFIISSFFINPKRTFREVEGEE